MKNLNIVSDRDSVRSGCAASSSRGTWVRASFRGARTLGAALAAEAGFASRRRLQICPSPAKPSVVVVVHPAAQLVRDGLVRRDAPLDPLSLSLRDLRAMIPSVFSVPGQNPCRGVVPGGFVFSWRVSKVGGEIGPPALGGRGETEPPL